MNNDLIDRTALLRKWDEKFFSMGGDRLGPNGDEIMWYLNSLLDEIKNAPTVDLWQMRQEATENAIKKAEVLYGRPQGEWIKVKEERMSIDMSGEIATRYKCSKCGRPITILPSKLADYPFCHCGAKMKGGTE